MNTNLNDLQARCGSNCSSPMFTNNTGRFNSVDCEVVFRDHESKMLSLIEEHNCVVGCVAWLTNHRILQALAKLPYVSIVVQKEDFLRPDHGHKKGSKARLRTLYSSVKNKSERHGWPGLLGKLSVATDPAIEAIRCVGIHNRGEKTSPKMHNKFLVFGNLHESATENGYEITLDHRSVWTGSYNITYNATQSLENAVILRDTRVAKLFYDEYCQIFALSEPLNWETEWVAPEYWIGT